MISEEAPSKAGGGLADDVGFFVLWGRINLSSGSGWSGKYPGDDPCHVADATKSHAFSDTGAMHEVVLQKGVSYLSY